MFAFHNSFALQSRLVIYELFLIYTFLGKLRLMHKQLSSVPCEMEMVEKPFLDGGGFFSVDISNMKKPSGEFYLVYIRT